MAKRALLSSASFSHLLGRAPKAGGRAEEEREDKDKKDPKDDDKARKGKSRAEEGDDDDKEERRKEEDEQDEDRRQDDDDDKEERRDQEDKEDEEEGEDEEDERDKKDAKASAARRRERARCAAIFASRHAAGRPDFAAHLAFNTTLGRNAAVAMLKAAPQAAQGGLAGRMAGMEAIRPGADGGRLPTERQARASSWDASAKRIGVAPR